MVGWPVHKKRLPFENGHEVQLLQALSLEVLRKADRLRTYFQGAYTMRNMIVSALFAAMALAPFSASAKSYEEAAASGVSPVTADEMLTCSFYWNAWAQSLNPNYYREGAGIWDKGWVATLNPAIQLPAAEITAKYWYERAKAKYERDGDRAAFNERMKNAPKYDVEALDERKFMQLLGECARPTK